MTADKRNNISNFVRREGKTKIVKKLLTASVAVEEGSLVYPDPGNAGQITKADATAGNFFGVIKETIATTDDNFASTKMVAVEVPIEQWVEWDFTVWSGTFTAADVDKYADLVDEKSVAVDTTTKKSVYITKFLTSTRGRCIIPLMLAQAVTS